MGASPKEESKAASSESPVGMSSEGTNRASEEEY
eukprot:CAMPEP_0201617030 /NCGR_PEP_ID=MMETSP0492-20130828/35334_1 /ASSEMBLY_ACC=CAM_ASM_000837 /TAXON_ID=420259 /ORGANISM="Thalassiosira gravida, Strain GMp14c1" /LENGTH=33 /DNA_ID= /DNA_START= /DNA_END= /DNA_ORIENTATION=